MARERPILFSAPMVRALLAGTKTQTRRAIKPQPFIDDLSNFHWNGWNYGQSVYGEPHVQALASPIPGSLTKRVACPFGKPGDRLWVREAWRIGAWDHDDGTFAIDYRASPEIKRTPWVTNPNDPEGEDFNNRWISLCDQLEARGVKADAEGRYRWEPGECPLPWRPSIHMPRWASRITLEIADVRVQRLQDISGLDAIAEGLDHVNDGAAAFGVKGFARSWSNDPRVAYRALWESINGAGSWDANPWVWAISFRVDHD